jgi:negative regulator of flagellin synthesis FlgM
MTEKINGQGFRPADTVGTRRSEATKPQGRSAADGGAPSAAPAGDTVNLTRSGLLMSKLEELVQSMPAVDAGRVRAIKDALASGSYEIDDRQVADKMLRLDRQLLG